MKHGFDSRTDYFVAECLCSLWGIRRVCVSWLGQMSPSILLLLVAIAVVLLCAVYVQRTLSALAGELREVRDKIAKLPDQASQNEEARANRTELGKNLKTFQEAVNEFQKVRFGELKEKQDNLVKATKKELELMRGVVDEKLQKTLNSRLNAGFEVVGNQLQAVQKGLGEMQRLATDVGDLTKMMSNVKERGNLGELLLEKLLGDMMAPHQYASQVSIRPGSRDKVDFVIKWAGQGEKETYLPIDAKFPQEDYRKLQDAHESGDKEGVGKHRKGLAKAVEKMAKDISEKYISPPHTTDFAIMYVPTEGLYAEISRHDLA